MHLTQWLQITLIFIIGAITPGPSTIYILNKAIHASKKDSILIAIGHGLGVMTLGILALVGVNLIIHHAPSVALTLKWISIIILLAFGLITLLSSKKQMAEHPTEKNNALSLLANLFKGYSFAMANPLVIVYFGAVFSQFTLLSHHRMTQITAMLLLFSIDALYYIMVVLFIQTEQSLRFVKQYTRHIAIGAGTLLIVIALSFML